MGFVVESRQKNLSGHRVDRRRLPYRECPQRVLRPSKQARDLGTGRSYSPEKSQALQSRSLQILATLDPKIRSQTLSPQGLSRDFFNLFGAYINPVMIQKAGRVLGG